MPNSQNRTALEEQKLPLHEDSVQVTRKTGSVSVSMCTDVRDDPTDEALTPTGAEIRHVAIDRIVDQLPQSRQVGDTFVVPVAEEVVVTRFLIRDETSIARGITMHRHQDSVVLKVEHATVTRIGGGGRAPSPIITDITTREPNDGK